MQTEQIANILISPNRQRREFEPEALMLLTESIKELGLMHPVVVRRDATGCHLVAGERRLRAIQDLWMLGGTLRCDAQALLEGYIPVVNLGDLDPLSAEEAELEENTIRTDLSWQERAASEARLHDLRIRQATATGSDHTIAATSREVHGNEKAASKTETRRSIIVAGKLADPEVAAAKTLDDAYKIIRKKDEATRNEQLAASVGKTFSIASHRAFNVDCVEWLTGCDAEQFDVVLTDPPYGMGADEFGDAGGALVGAEHAYKDDFVHFTSLMESVHPHLFRVCKPQAHLYMFCDVDNFTTLKIITSAAGWKVHRTPIVWHKTQAHRVPWPECGPRRHYELVLYAVKGNKRVNRIAPDVISTGVDENLGLAAQKPVGLFTELLSRSCRPGDRILDPFCGTGPVFPAAHSLKVAATGLEQSQATYGIALKRIQKLAE